VWVLKTVSPAAMLKRNVIIKLSKCFLERVRPQTKADSKLQLKSQRQAHTCGNALLAAGIHILGLDQRNDFQIIKVSI
jgi:hypothetical protein